MDDELDFGEYLRILRKHWVTAFVSFIIVLGAVIAYTYLSMPVYETKSLILVTSQDQANAILGSSTSKTTADLESQKVIIQSSNVMNPIYIKYGEKSFTVTPNIIKNSNIIEINVETSTPENAVTIANDIAESYVNYTAELKKQEAEKNMEFITDKISAYDKELNILDLESAYYKNNANTLTRQEKLDYQVIQREIAAKTKIYDYLLTKKEEAAITANANTANLKILQYAELPESPSKPNFQLNIALGIILALGAAFGAAMIVNGFVQEKKPRRDRF